MPVKQAFVFCGLCLVSPGLRDAKGLQKGPWSVMSILSSCRGCRRGQRSARTAPSLTGCDGSESGDAAAFPWVWSDTVFEQPLVQWLTDALATDTVQENGRSGGQNAASDFKWIAVILATVLGQPSERVPWALLRSAEQALPWVARAGWAGCHSPGLRRWGWEFGATVLCRALPLPPGESQKSHLTSGGLGSLCFI